MDPDFWHQRWREGRIGFHQARVTPLLEECWDDVAVPAGARVFVPLAGKSLDMAWLAARGHPLLGVELSRLAVEEFFAEHGLEPAMHETCHGWHYRAGGIELVCGDAFALDREALASCAGVFDRAALIALPPDLRRRYAGELYARLPSGCRGLLVTLEYPPHEKQGPPFAVREEEVRALFGDRWHIDLLRRHAILDQQPGFAEEGVTSLDTVAYRMERRA
ncbi:MAG: thiopurine S-methyltransferase [Pseudomonadota bacterium]|nr:thiopurine S-methyltransferase [Pseudomonadota bacterium]